MKRRHLFAGVAGLAASTLLLAACGNGPTPAAAPTPTEDPSGSITFWHFWSSAVRRTAIREVIGVCEQQLPQIKVREIAKPYGDIWTDNIAAVAAGTGMPDVIVEDRPQLPDRAINGIAQPISGLADRDGVDSAQFYMERDATRRAELRRAVRDRRARTLLQQRCVSRGWAGP